MSEEQNEKLFDLLVKKAICGLDEAEQRELGEIDIADTESHSLELTAAAISIAGLTADEPLPAHLYSKIAADASRFVGAAEAKPSSPWPPVKPRELGLDTIMSPREIESPPVKSWFQWLGWPVAIAACIVLALNIWLTQTKPFDIKPPIEEPNVQTQAQMRDRANNKPKILTPTEMREEMMSATAGMVKANWQPGNMKELKQIAGDVVWSDEKQAGYMRLRGLPINDAAKETYQLWIFDKNQDKATPIDGGTFDVSSDGEVVISINAKLKAKGPEMFAITIEKAGGVVVSKREKIAALAKVENQPS